MSLTNPNTPVSLQDLYNFYHRILPYLGSSSGGGTNDYTDLDNKPSIEGVSLTGNKTAADLGLAKANAIPTKVSDLTNDSNFITNTVNNLVNYYLSSQLYTKTEIDSIVTAIKNSRFEAVSSLPTSNIKTNIIYLIPASSSDTNNIKDEYINLDGTTAGWEKIGSTSIDLSGYVTTTALNTALADYTNTTNLTSLLAAKQDTIQVSTMPTASATTVNKIYQFMGTTDSTYTHGYFYETKQNNSTYSWQQVNVQPSTGGGHTIIDGNGTQLNQETNLKFSKDFDVSDDSTNHNTEVEQHELSNAEWNEIMATLPLPNTSAPVDSQLSNTSENPIQNKAVKAGLDAKADLVSGKVPSSQLPSFVDDVIEGYYKVSDGKFYQESNYQTEITGEAGKIYISVDTNIQYRWTGNAFSPLGGALILGETSSTAYRGDRGKTAYEDSQTNKANIGTLSNLTTTNKSSLVDAINEVKANSNNGPSYTAGNGIDITNDTVSVDEMPSSDMSEVMSPLPGITPKWHTYSTEEQAIGTWIDGKTIYEKTFYKASIAAAANTATVTDLGDATNCNLINSFGHDSFANSIPRGYNVFDAWGRIANNKFQLYINTVTSAKTITDVYMTFQYTKS